VDRFLTKDFLSGAMFIVFGLTALYFGQNLAQGTAVLSYILLGLGGLICVVSLFSPGESVERLKWKPITLVTIGIVCFALLFERAGLLPALVALVLISSLGGEEFKLTEVIGNMVVLAILCIIVFKVGLGMNISIVQGIW